MIVFSVMFLFSAICAWIMTKHEEEQEKRDLAWKLLALAAVAELKKRDEEDRKDGEQ